MSTKTPNYNLHQWAPEDHFLRTDFNEDFSKIDTGIKAAKTAGESAAATVQTNLNSAKSTLAAATATKCVLYTGAYTGDGATTREITLGVHAKMVLVETNTATRVTNVTCGGMALRGYSLNGPYGGPAVTITPTGFTVSASSTTGTNTPGLLYYYMALC